MAKVAPVLAEKAHKVIMAKIREGQPFTLAECAKNKELAELALKCAPEPEDRYGRPLSDYLSLVLNFVVKRRSISDKLYKRFDRGLQKAERKGPAYVLYPSNDRERFHLKDSEVFIPISVTKGSKLWKAFSEPPVRIVESPEKAPTETETTVEVPPDPYVPQNTRQDEIENIVALVYSNMEKISFACSLINTALIEQIKLVDRLANLKEA